MGRIFWSKESLKANEQMILWLVVFRSYSRIFQAWRLRLFSTHKNRHTFHSWPWRSCQSFGRVLTRFLWQYCILQKVENHHRLQRNLHRQLRQLYLHYWRRDWIDFSCVKCLSVKEFITFGFAVVIKILVRILSEVSSEAVGLIDSDFHF